MLLATNREEDLGDLLLWELDLSCVDERVQDGDLLTSLCSLVEERLKLAVVLVERTAEAAS